MRLYTTLQIVDFIRNTKYFDLILKEYRDAKLSFPSQFVIFNVVFDGLGVEVTLCKLFFNVKAKSQEIPSR